MALTCPACQNPLAPSRSYCNNRCQQEYQYKLYIERWLAGLETGHDAVGTGKNVKISGRVRRYLFEKYGEKCSKCGWAERSPSSGKIPLTTRTATS